MRKIFSEQRIVGGYEHAQVVDAYGDGQRVERDWFDVLRITTAHWDKGTGVLIIDHRVEIHGYSWDGFVPERRYATHHGHSTAIRAVIADADAIDVQIVGQLPKGYAEVLDEAMIAAWPGDPLLDLDSD